MDIFDASAQDAGGGNWRLHGNRSKRSAAGQTDYTLPDDSKIFEPRRMDL